MKKEEFEPTWALTPTNLQAGTINRSILFSKPNNSGKNPSINENVNELTK